MKPKIELRRVGKVYHSAQGWVQALRGVDLDVEEGEFMCLVGPSGCGKTTLLRILADLDVQSSGEVIVRSANNRPRSAVVFQEYALFPWRTARDNVAFGPEMRAVPRWERKEAASHYLEKMGLSAFADHFPHQLSGGMKQRIALARALANEPEILLMDEPFSAADAQTRSLLQLELLRIWEEEKKTVLYVTHSIEEAVLLGDRVALMTARPGRVKAVFPVGLPRPREFRLRHEPEFRLLSQSLWESLIEEVDGTIQREEGRQ